MAQLVSNLQKIAGEINAASKKALQKTAEDVGVLAQAGAPVRTGKLRKSLQIDVGEESARVGFTAIYAPYVELGTSNMAGAFFLLSAFLQSEAIFKKHLEDELKNI